MRIHPININNIGQNIFASEKNNYNANKKTVSSDTIWKYLNITGSYNISFSMQRITFYSIDENGNYKKYSSMTQAIKELGANSTRISDCLNGTKKKIAGHTFVLPEKIETVDENGNITIDKNKVDEIVSSAFEKANPIPIYAVNEEGEHKRFPDIKDAASEFSVWPSRILKCMSGEVQKRVNGYTFIRAEEVEYADENNRIRLNAEKLKQMGKDASLRKSFVPIYAIGIDGSCTRHVNKKRTARLLGIDNSVLTKYLKGKCNSDIGYEFVYADEVESIGKNGEVILDYNILREKFIQANKNAVYAISKDGSYQKYKSQAEAARQLSLDSDRISRCINGKISRVNGYVFVKANDIDSFDNGTLTVNTKMIKKFATELAAPRVKAIYAFDEQGNYQRHDCIKSLVNDLPVYMSGVKKCLGNEYKTCHGYRFIYAENFEKFDEDGNIVVDYDKLDAISDEINPGHKRQIDKFGKIYTIRNGNEIKEFPNIRIAARELGIDESSILYFLRNGNNPQDGTNTIQNFVFTCERYK